jgi:hypothetical protein
MAMTNAEKQRRWRDKRNARAEAFDGTPKEVAEALLVQLGVAQVRNVVRALDKRLRNIKPDCRACGGTGRTPVRFFSACGTPILGKADGTPASMPCDCSPEMRASSPG